jgi:hypothetical protein
MSRDVGRNHTHGGGRAAPHCAYFIRPGIGAG